MRRIVYHAIMALLVVGVVALAGLAACDPESTIPAGIQVERVFSDLSFQEMTNLVQSDDASGLIFITEQRGVIYTFSANNSQQADIFLDITDRVNRGGAEEGLLGLALDPDYKENGYFYVYYSAADPSRSVLSRFSIDEEDRDVADPESEVTIMEVAQPYANHNAGQLAFGPDGYFYIGLGDGGGSGDPLGNAQNLSTVLGSILRIDAGYRHPAIMKYLPIIHLWVLKTLGKRYGHSACEIPGGFPLIWKPGYYGLLMSGKTCGRK